MASSAYHMPEGPSCFATASFKFLFALSHAQLITTHATVMYDTKCERSWLRSTGSTTLISIFRRFRVLAGGQALLKNRLQIRGYRCRQCNCISKSLATRLSHFYSHVLPPSGRASETVKICTVSLETLSRCETKAEMQELNQ